nr:MAG TPA: hypothetical protein [Caudoviricetes sp.]
MKINDSIFVELMRYKHDALSDLWSFIKRFIKYVWGCFLSAVATTFVVLLVYRVAEWVFGGCPPLYLTIGVVIATVIYGYILRDTF